MNRINSKKSQNKNELVISNAEMLGLIEELLEQGKKVRLTIKGNSMKPLLRDGLDQVEISIPDEREIIKGAIVLFRYGNDFLLHRVISRKENQIFLRGDNVFQSIETVNTEQVIGIVRKIIYLGGQRIKSSTFRWKILSTCWLLLKPACRPFIHFINWKRRISDSLK